MLTAPAGFRLANMDQQRIAFEFLNLVPGQGGLQHPEYINSRLTIPENDKSAIVVVETPDQKTFATRAFATVAGCLSQATALYR